MNSLMMIGEHFSFWQTVNSYLQQRSGKGSARYFYQIEEIFGNNLAQAREARTL
jgi:hypothetical protein